MLWTILFILPKLLMSTAIRDMKIFGGYVVSPHGNPFMAFISVVAPERKIKCSASIIDQKWVLTAAHCTETALGRGGVYPPDVFTVIVGSNNVITGSYDKDYEEFKVASVHRPPLSEYVTVDKGTSSERPYLINDLALIELASPIRFNEAVQPILITRNESILPITEFFSSGWGKTADHQPGLDALRELGYDMILKDDEICYKSTWDELEKEGKTNPIVCTETTISNPCGGDSGGPLFVRLTNSKGVKVATQIGVLGSSITEEPLNCSHDQPVKANELWARVSKYCDWIEETTGLAGLCSPDDLNGFATK